MQGNAKVIDQLNKSLANEHTAIAQYVVHSEMCSNWGYDKLADLMMTRARQEMKHAGLLVERILFLEGTPNITKMNQVLIGKQVEEMHENDHAAEVIAINGYNEAIATAVECGDNGSRKLFESILADEESHIDIIEQNLTQIEQMSIDNYLVEQL